MFTKMILINWIVLYHETHFLCYYFSKRKFSLSTNLSNPGYDTFACPARNHSNTWGPIGKVEKMFGSFTFVQAVDCNWYVLIGSIDDSLHHLFQQARKHQKLSRFKAVKRGESNMMRYDFKHGVLPLYLSFTRIYESIFFKKKSITDFKLEGGENGGWIKMIACHFKEESNYQFRHICKYIDNSNQG